ncbi:hypothetical protein F383_35238 [Gossypium arboreum]|uniref:Uncharacterized protein n=1 Tax=Gossypium arboreum TaxID=29729 RepID=A0A0B0PXU9_GOSAR|nr:hypothetical protein F383_35238 [Gossypium arboreum]
MPNSPKNWPILNRTIVGLGRDTLVPWSRLLNRHERVVCPCKSCFNPAKWTRLCDTPM